MKTSFSTDEADVLRARADALMEIGRWRDAVPLLQSALRFAPDDARLHCRMANAHIKLGDRKQALLAADRAIAANPTEEWGHRIRCTILLKGRDKQQTLRAAQEAVSLAPRKVEPLYVLTQALLHLRKTDEARRTAEQLRQIAPNSVWAHEALTLVALRQGQWIEAEIHCRTLLKINPHFYSAFNNLGVALRAMKRLPEAATAFLEAVRLNPLEPLSRRNLQKTLHFYFHDTVYWSFAGVGMMGFFGFLPLGDHATYGPRWEHIALFLGAILLVPAGLYWGYRRHQSLPTVVCDYISQRYFKGKFHRK